MEILQWQHDTKRGRKRRFGDNLDNIGETAEDNTGETVELTEATTSAAGAIPNNVITID